MSSEIVSPGTADPAAAPARRTGVPGFLAGLAAGALTLGLAEAAAALSEATPSPVASVGDAVIDGAPGWLVRQGIESAGTNDKPALIVTIVILSLLAAGWLGQPRRRWGTVIAGFGMFALVGALAMNRQADASAVGCVLVVAVAAAAGLAALRVLRGLAPVAGTPQPGRPGASIDRRVFLVAAGATAALGLAFAGMSRSLRSRFDVAAVRERVRGTFPKPRQPAPVVAGLDAQGVSPLITPNADFYRIDTAIVVPQVDPDSWRLRFTGMVDSPYEITYGELLDLDLVEHEITLCCVSNDVGGDLVGNARWLGVPLASLLERAGVQAGADQLVGRSVDGFTVGFPTSLALDGRAALVAVGMNGEPLPVVHGFPARLVVPGLYGYVSATKWLKEIELTTWDAFDAYWIPLGWAEKAPIKTQSRIDTPRNRTQIEPGPVGIGGVAWAQTRGIRRVEVQIDDGDWIEATLGDVAGPDTWRQWVLTWDAEPGEHTIAVRATDDTGEVQTAEPAPPAPDGATGHHTIRVDVRG